MTIGVFQEGLAQFTVIDLSGATPVSTNHTLPFSGGAYAATSASSWLVRNGYGAILDGASLGGQPRYLTLGQVLSIAAGTGYFSVATASGRIFNFDASTDALLGTINFTSSQLSMSADGSVLAAAALASPLQNPPATSVNVYSLPSAMLINSFPFGPAVPIDMSLSGSGTVLGMASNSGCEAEAVVAASGTQIVCVMSGGLYTVQVSPDRTLVAASTAPARVGTTTTIYTNGALTTAVNGWAVGWLDNMRLLANQFGQQNQNPNPVYLGAEIFSFAGTNLGSAPLPQLQTLQAVSSDSMYSPQTNTIISLTSGASIWASADASCSSMNNPCHNGTGAVSGSQVIFPAGALVLAQPY